jgi:hypothetical protein
MLALVTRPIPGLVWLPAVLAGCLAPDISGTHDAIVVARGPDGTYGLHAREVTADDLVALDGESVRFVSRPTLTIDPDLLTIDVDGDEGMHVTYADQDGALLATDYLGLIGVTAYHHLSAAHAYFRGLGLGAATDDIAQQRVFFLPKLRVAGGGGGTANDNIAFIPLESAFLVLAEKQLDAVPLAANEGVVAHEFSHSVLHHRFADGSNRPPNETFGWDSTSANYWASLHEGLADVHGAGITGEPNFILPSAGPEFGINRDVSSPDHILTDALLLDVESSFSYDPYPLGSVLAATLWSYRDALIARGDDRDAALAQMSQLAFDAMDALAPDAAGFHVADYLSAGAAVAPAGDVALWCGAVDEHFALVSAMVVGCP